MGYGSFRYKLIPFRCEWFHVLGLKNKEYLPKIFFLFNFKLYLKWSKFKCNFTAWVHIKRTCIETTLYQNDQFPWHAHVCWWPSWMRDLGLFQLWVTVHVLAVAIHYRYVRGAKGYGILAVLVWNRVSILTNLVWNRVWFVHSRLELGMFFWRSYFFIITW